YITTVEDRLPVENIPYREVPSNLQPAFGTPTCAIGGASCTSNANCTGTGNFCQQPRFLYYDSYLWALDRNGAPLVSPASFPGSGQYSSLNGISADLNYVYFGAYDGINWRMSILRAPRNGGATSVLANFGLSGAFFWDLASSSNGNVLASYAYGDVFGTDY